MVIFEPTNIFPLETEMFFPAGQFAFPFYLSFDQALPVKLCSPTLNWSAQFALVQVVVVALMLATTATSHNRCTSCHFYLYVLSFHEDSNFEMPCLCN